MLQIVWQSYLHLPCHETAFQILISAILWPLVFAYSHLSGLHYPIDILCGYLFGIFQDTPSIKRISISKKSIFSLALELLPLYISILYYKIIFQLQWRLRWSLFFCLENLFYSVRISITIGAIKNKNTEIYFKVLYSPLVRLE
jgi:membrane-associated phospholipid phosphatase